MPPFTSGSSGRDAHSVRNTGHGNAAELATMCSRKASHSSSSSPDPDGPKEIGGDMSSTAATGAEIRSFETDIPQQRLDDLHSRVVGARLPSKELVDDRSQGVQLATIQAIARYWTTQYDWRRAEA